MKTTVLESFFNKLEDLYSKVTPKQVFSCEIWEIFKNAYFEEHLRTPASKWFCFLLPLSKLNSLDEFCFFIGKESKL